MYSVNNSVNVPWVQDPTVGNVLSRTLSAYRANFLSMFGLTVVVNIPITILAAYMTLPLLQRISQLVEQMTPAGQSPSAMPTFNQADLNQLLGVYSSFALTQLAINFLVFVLVFGALTYLTSEFLFGRRVSLIEAFSAISGRLPLFSIALLIVAVLLAGLTYGMTILLFLCGFGFGIIAWFGAGLVPFLTPVFMLERTNIGAGISRAFALGKLHLWPIVRTVLAIGVVYMLLPLLISYLLPDTGTATTASTQITFTTDIIISLVISGVINALLLPLFPVAFTIMYYDARVRYEGLDAALATVGKSDARPADTESPPAGPLIERRDVSNMLIMTMIVFGVLIAFYAVMFGLLAIS